MIDQCAMKWKKHMMKARRWPHFSLEAAKAVFKQATRGDENDRCEISGLQFPAFSLSLKHSVEISRFFLSFIFYVKSKLAYSECQDLTFRHI